MASSRPNYTIGGQIRLWRRSGDCAGLWLGVKAEMCFILYSHRWLTVTQTDDETSEGDSIALQHAHCLRRLLLTVQLYNFSCEMNDLVPVTYSDYIAAALHLNT